MSPESIWQVGAGAAAGSLVQRGRVSSGGVVAPDTFVLGTTKPTQNNTGYNPDLINGTLTGTQTYSTANTTISNKIINGDVLIRNTGITLNNCLIAGRTDASYPGYSGVVDCTSSGWALNNCTIRPRNPAYYHNGINGAAGGTAYRCDISYVCDMFAMKGGCKAQGCYMHNHVLFDGQDTANGNGSDHYNDIRFPGWTHNDCVQMYSGAGNEVEGCNMVQYFVTDYGQGATSGITGLDATPSAAAGYTVATTIGGAAATGTCQNGTTNYSNGGRNYPSRNYDHGVFIGPKQGTITSALVKNNWFEGGEVGLQIATQSAGFDTGNTITVSGNRFGLDIKTGFTGNSSTKHTAFSSAAIGTITVTSDNIFDPTAASVPTIYQGQPITNFTATLAYGVVNF